MLKCIGEPDAQAKLFEAISKARENFDEVIKDSDGQTGHQKFKYANMNTLVRSSKEALSQAGVAVVMAFSDHETNPERVCLTTILAGHGAQIHSTISFEMPEDIKEFGRVSTYLRRYAYQALFVLDGDEDADATAAPSLTKRRLPPPVQKEPYRQPTSRPPAKTEPGRTEHEEPISDAQMARIRNLRTDLGLSPMDVTRICADRYNTSPQAMSYTMAAEMIDYLLGLQNERQIHA